jgi:hypothetical protein
MERRKNIEIIICVNEFRVVKGNRPWQLMSRTDSSNKHIIFMRFYLGEGRKILKFYMRNIYSICPLI